MKSEKDFDCVEMMHEGQKYVAEQLAGLTLEQKLEYWRKRTEELKEFMERKRGEQVEDKQQ